MSFHRAFWRVLFWRPIKALEALFWHATGRRQRARNRLRMIGAQSPFAYQLWIDKVEHGENAAAAVANPERRPLLSVIFYDDPAEPHDRRTRTLAALRVQHYSNWELVLVRAYDSPPPPGLARLTLAPGFAANGAEALNLGVTTASGEFVMPLPGGAILPPGALCRYAQALQGEQSARVAILYGDHDAITLRNHRFQPWFKPRWNPEMFLAQDYISPACMIRTTAARAALPIPAALTDAASYALLLAVARPEQLAGEAGIIHISHILAHLPEPAHPDNHPARAAAVAHHLAPVAATMVTPGPFGSVRVDWPLPVPPPLVSIIIPTRDQVRLLRTCVLGVLEQTSYPNFEIVIVDNGSRAPETLAFLKRIATNPKVRVLDYNQPFNFSAINNFAVREARGSYLCLLNNDIEIIDEHWLTALMRQATRAEVGAAGAKLLYEDRTIQHAGVVIGLGDAAGHAHRYQRDDQPGYFARAHVAHVASAVTAACCVVAKAKYAAVGGLDEARFAVAFNDVDFCLKLEQAGWHNIYVPQAVAIHHESKSRGRDFLPANIERYKSELAALQDRWATPGYNDPLHHPHLDAASETYRMDIPF